MPAVDTADASISYARSGSAPAVLLLRAAA